MSSSEPVVVVGGVGGGVKLEAGGPRARNVSSSQAAEKLVTVEWALERRRRWLDALENDPQARVVEVDVSCRVWKKPVLRALLEGIADTNDDEEDVQGDGADGRYASDPLLSRVLPTLRTLRFDDVVAQLSTEDGLDTYTYLARVFGGSRSLRRVSLDDNALGTRGVDRLRPLLGLETLRYLSMYNCGLAQADAEILSETLFREPKTGRIGLEGLRVSRNQIGPEGIKALGDRILAHCPGLRELDVSGTRAGKKGTRAVVAGLVKSGCHLTIRRLELDDAGLAPDDDEGDRVKVGEGEDGYGFEGGDPVPALCGFLQQTVALEVLGLNDTGMGEARLKLVLKALGDSESRRTLRVLRVGELGSEDVQEDDDDEEAERDDDADGGGGGATFFAQILARALPHLVALEELHVQENELGNAGARIIVKALSSASLPMKLLNLSTNSLSCVDFLLRYPIPGLQTLLLADNMDLADDVEPEDRDEVNGLYRRVVWDDEEVLEHEHHEDAHAGGGGAGVHVDDEEGELENQLSQAFGGAAISS
jgi:Ran GTPase-activating protein (RanGAP) involved in mRNA processing and transport